MAVLRCQAAAIGAEARNAIDDPRGMAVPPRRDTIDHSSGLGG
jgi:hypothetical protein